MSRRSSLAKHFLKVDEEPAPNRGYHSKQPTHDLTLETAIRLPMSPKPILKHKNKRPSSLSHNLGTSVLQNGGANGSSAGSNLVVLDSAA